MILDILIIALILLCCFLGFRKGFAYTFIHTAGWIMALMLAFMLTDKFKVVLEATPFAKEHIPEIPTSEMMPEILQNNFIGFTHEMILSIVAFIILFIGIKLIMSILLHIYTHSIGGGFTGFIDGTLGLALGMLKGIILVYIILLVCVPLVETLAPDMVGTIDQVLASSQLAEDLYNNNPFAFLLENNFFV